MVLNTKQGKLLLFSAPDVTIFGKEKKGKFCFFKLPIIKRELIKLMVSS